MTDIFVSYKREDRRRVAPIVGAFETAGLSVYWDTAIPIGTAWRDQISRFLSEATVVVVVWTHDSVNSQWVLDEAGEGLRRNALVPIVLDPVEQPLGFRGIHAANLQDWGGDVSQERFRSLLRDIQALLESARQAKRSNALVVEPLPPAAPTQRSNRVPAIARWAILLGFVLLVALGAYILHRTKPSIEILREGLNKDDSRASRTHRVGA